MLNNYTCPKCGTTFKTLSVNRCLICSEPVKDAGYDNEEVDG